MSRKSTTALLRRIRRANVVWLDGREAGLVADPHDVMLNPYHSDDFEHLVRVFLHEVVHQEYPELNEGAVWATAGGLMQSSVVRLAAAQQVGGAILAAVKALRRRRKGITIG